MDGRAISAAAIGRAGLGLLTGDFGETRLAETPRLRSEEREARPAAMNPARATRP